MPIASYEMAVGEVDFFVYLNDIKMRSLAKSYYTGESVGSGVY